MNWPNTGYGIAERRVRNGKHFGRRGCADSAALLFHHGSETVVMTLLADAVGAFFATLLAPLRNMLADVVREVMVEFTVDDPSAGGPYACYKCDGETEHGVCPQCQPLAYARLSD